VAAADSSAVAADSSAGQVAQAEAAAADCGAPGSCFTAGTLVLTASGRVAIESLRVGRKVLTEWTKGEPPSLESQHGTAVDPASWKLVRLRMPNPGGGDTIDIELLRPAAWVRERHCDAFRHVPMSLPELGAEGGAEVLSIDPCPPLQAGPGRVVTATVTHLNSHVLEVKLAGLERPLEPTEPHRFFSEDRGDWVAADDLEAGERLRTAEGEVAAVVEQTRVKPGVHRVYNIEVEHEHQYFVSTLGVLVHNVYEAGPAGTGDLEALGNDPYRHAVLANSEVSDVHPSLPVYGTRGRATSGTLVTPDGEAYLVSGKGPGQSIPGFEDYAINKHVEAHAAAIMRSEGIESAELFINKPEGPCTGGAGCSDLLRDMLPTGYVLKVHWPNGGYEWFTGY
jgi:hypothetical protein